MSDMRPSIPATERPDLNVRTINAIEARGLRAAVVESDRATSVGGIWHDERHHYVDLCLTSRPPSSRGCFADMSNRLINLGEVFYVPAGWRMRARGGTGHQRVLRLFLFDHDGADMVLSTAAAADYYLQVRSQPIRDNLLKISAEVLRPGFASHMLVEGLSLMVLAELLRLGRLRSSEQLRVGGLSPWRLRLIRERIEDGRNLPDVAELAAACKLSPRHLMRAFREETGQTLGSFVAAHALERAKARLEKTETPVSQIAREAGFGSSSSFAAAFRRATGTSPTSYRASMSSRLRSH